MRLIRIALALSLGLFGSIIQADERARARDLGLRLEGTTGQYNAITDVPGIAVGHTTLIEGQGKLEVGQGPVRTGVTVLLPRPKEKLAQPLYAAVHVLNGVGELTGSHYIEETGQFLGPVAITNTHSVGVVRDAIGQWLFTAQGWPVSLPVVGETLDGSIGGWRGLNDANGHHIQPEHVFAAIEGARGGVVEEGSVGGGTGMICNGFKGGIGTSSRIVAVEEESYTVGVLVQCNYGLRRWLRVEGVPVGEVLSGPKICFRGDVPEGAIMPSCDGERVPLEEDLGSIIIVLATDAPLMPHQLERVARRITLGLGRLGSASGGGSGDIFLAFSTIEPESSATHSELNVLVDGWLNPIFEATVQATEEAVLNSMLQSPTMLGADNLEVPGLPHQALLKALGRDLE